jgi:hypothetical protein
MGGARAEYGAGIGLEVVKFIANIDVNRNSGVVSLGGSAMQE